MDERDLLVLRQLESAGRWMTIPVLQWKFPVLQQWSGKAVSVSLVKLINLGYAERSMSRPERETIYAITEKGREKLSET